MTPTSAIVTDGYGNEFCTSGNQVLELANSGTILAPCYSNWTVIANINNPYYGNLNPGIAVDSLGNVLGTTSTQSQGSSFSYGAVFEIQNTHYVGNMEWGPGMSLDPSHPAYGPQPLVLHNFSSADPLAAAGAIYPNGGLTFDAMGDLFGSFHNVNGVNTQFEIQNNGNLEATQYTYYPLVTGASSSYNFVAPLPVTITGTANQTVYGGAAPFSGVTITDPNYGVPNTDPNSPYFGGTTLTCGSTDTLIITIGGVGAAPNLTYDDHPWFNIGPAGSNRYMLQGSPDTVTAQLRSLQFTMSAQGTATFNLSLTSNANPGVTVTSSFTVTNTDPYTVAGTPNPPGVPPMTLSCPLFQDTCGHMLLGSQQLGPTFGTGWHSDGTGDFYRCDKSDILFQHDNGTVATWQVQNNAMVSSNVIADPGPAWHVKGTGDFYGDGHSGALFQNNSGNVAVWDISNGHICQSGAVANPGTSWHVEGSGDFNGDGKSDIMFQNDNGNVAVWDMNGSHIAQGTAITNPGTAWHLVGNGDFYGDGKDDLLFQNTDNRLAIWELDNSNHICRSAVIGAVQPGTHVASVGADVFHDGGCDIILQNSAGAMSAWDMVGGYNTRQESLTAPCIPTSINVYHG
jgi:hypothetical protein